MCARNNVDAARFQLFYDAFLLGGCAETAQHFRFYRKPVEAVQNRIVMLKGEYRGRDKHCNLFTVADAFERGTQSNLRFAESHVAAEKSVHRARLFHIMFYFVNASHLIVRFFVFKAVFKIVLHIYIGRKSVARHCLTRRI